MGLLLSILFSYAGAIEFMFIVRDIVHRIGLHHEKMKFNRNQSNVTSTLHELQDGLRNSIKEARIQLYESDCIHSMADGVQYEDGYRILPNDEQNSEKRFLQSRAIASIEPSSSHMVEANDVVKSIVNESQSNIDAHSKRECSNSKITDSTDNEIAIDMNHLNGNNNDVSAAACEMPNIHFDEYTPHDKSYNYDSVTMMSGCQQQQQQQQKNADSGRRKSFKVYTNTGSSHVTADEFQRRRSKDIDGEMDNPWGELRPENFHDANLWSRERAMSIAENEESIGCVDEKKSTNNANIKHDVKAPNRATAMTVSTMEMYDNRVPIHEKKIGKTFGEPDETYESDVSSEIPSSLPHYFDEVNPACDDDDDENNSRGAGQMRMNVPEILVDGLDINEIVEDYTIDDNDIELDKHQFKEYFEKPNRLRHSSYNYEIDEEDNEGDLNEFSIVQKNEDEDEDEEGDEAADLVSENETIDTNSVVGIKQGRKGRKPNMFASSFRGIGSDNEHEPRPLVRITATEDERVEHFLQEENITNTNRGSSAGGGGGGNGGFGSGSGDILIKSKTTQMFECHNDENTDDAGDSYESRANSPTSVASPIYVTRRESMVSDNGSEPPIQFECKRQQQPDSPNYFYSNRQREDSSSSNKSNVLFELGRSPSHFSELEYIKGRDDWRDDYMRSSISEEVDSDNYHHLRRHSEAADTLEYIRGREDWLARNEVYHNQRKSLAQIFEVGEPKLLIQDEIDSDEYHHNFFQHSISEPGCAPINKLSESLNQKNFQEQFVAENVGGNEISVITNLNNVHNEHPIALPSNNTIMFDKSNQHHHHHNDDDDNNEIDVVIEDLIIKHDTINNDDIEITVWDLTPECHKNNPFIFISETTTTATATTDNQDIPNDERNSNQSNALLYPNSVNTSNSTELTSNKNFDSECSSSSSMAKSNENNNNNSNSSSSSNINEFLNAEIQYETKNRPQILSDDKIEKDIEIEIESKSEQNQENKRKMRAKSERIDFKTAGLLNPNEQKPRRTLSFENVEDLIEQCSNGPWFHK